jgi:hypothetical protein
MLSFCLIRTVYTLSSLHLCPLPPAAFPTRHTGVVLGVESHVLAAQVPLPRRAQQSGRNCSRSEAFPKRRLSGQEPPPTQRSDGDTFGHVADIGPVESSQEIFCCALLMSAAVVQAPASHQLPIRR